MIRLDGRLTQDIRRIEMQRNRLKYAEGSVVVKYGDTEVICAATIEDKVPQWLRGKGRGWLTAEYCLLPRSTQERNQREVSRGRQTGRTMEIQRLIGRSLRSVLDFERLGERTIHVDCDVIQADGGTRTAAISGGFVAMVEAIATLDRNKNIAFPVVDFLAAVSVGLLDNHLLLDLSFAEDSLADVDLNVIMNGQGNIIEVQGTAEKKPFSITQLNEMIILASKGIESIIEKQKDVLANLSWKVGSK